MNAPANINHAALGSIELEQEVLGAALINSAFEVIERAVSAGDFSEHLHSQLFETFAAVHASQGIITPAIVIASMGGDASRIVVARWPLPRVTASLSCLAESAHC